MVCLKSIRLIPLEKVVRCSPLFPIFINPKPFDHEEIKNNTIGFTFLSFKIC
jgi:hypothetical protein